MRPITPRRTHRTTVLSEEGRAFLQHRTGRYALLLGGIGLGFWVFRWVLVFLAGVDGEFLEEAGMGGHFLGAAAMLAIWAINAWGVRSASFVRASELGLLTVSCAGYAWMISEMPSHYRPDYTLLLIFSIALLGRSIYVPASWQWTAALSLPLGAAVLGAAYWTVENADETYRGIMLGDVSGLDLTAVMVTNAAAWWIGIAALASASSAVIYGLRREAARGRRLGQYTLVRKLGEGGIGMVFEAHHAMLRRPTAVKLLQPEKVDEASLARFEREVRATAALRHPNTVRVFDYGRTPDGVFYYAMERVPGCTLTRAVEASGPMPVERALLLLHQIAGALAEAHESGLVHRDVKPDNVLFCPMPGYGDVAKVVDFGLVRELDAADAGITRQGSIVGTPHYLAPEVIKGETADARSDLYALGCVAYYLLTAEQVFGGGTVVEVCSRHLSDAPPTLAEGRLEPVGEALEALVARCLEKDRDARFASAAELQDALERLEGFGAWTRERSRQWWNDFGPDVRDDLPGNKPVTDTRTLAIDLGRRT